MDVELVLSDKSKNTDLLVVIEGVTWHSEISQVHCEKMDLPCGEVVFVGVSLTNQAKVFAYSALYQRAQLAPNSASACALA